MSGQIPSHPAIQAQLSAAGASPAQTPQADPRIPAHPMIQAQQAVASGTVQPPAMNPWDELVFDDVPGSGEPEAAAPVAQPSSTPAPAPTTQAAPVAELPELPNIEEFVQTPEQPAVTTAPPTSQPTPAPQAPDFEKIQSDAINYLMANDYRLDDEDRSKLISEPDVVLPKLAARMHVSIATQIARQVAQAVPVMIESVVNSRVAAREAEMEFYSKYPSLNRPEYRSIVQESIRQVRTFKPQANREEIMRDGAAWAAFQIRSRSAPMNPQVPQAPVAPPRGPTAPFVPALPGGGAVPPTAPQAQMNPWAELAMDPDLF